MNNREQDRRTSKTLQAIHESLLSLMLEKPYDKITIQNIIDRANVGRSTFYSHFATKDELLISSIEQMLEMLNKHIVNHSAESGDKSRLIPVDELFDHIKENSRLMRALIRARSVICFLKRLKAFGIVNWKLISIHSCQRARSPKFQCRF